MSRATSVFVIHSDRFRLEIQEECDNLLWSRIFISLLFFQKWKSNTNLVEKGVQSMTTPGKKKNYFFARRGGSMPSRNKRYFNCLIKHVCQVCLYSFIVWMDFFSFLEFYARTSCHWFLDILVEHHHDCTLGHLYCPKEEEEEGAPNFCSISARSQREDVLDTGQRMKPVCLYYWPHSAFGFFLGEDGTHLLCFFLLRTQSRRIEIKWPWKKKNKRTIPASIEYTF